MSKKEFTPSFDVQAVEGFGAEFRKVPWDVKTASEEYEITGEVTPNGIPVYVYKLTPGLKKRSIKFELENVLIDECDLTYTGADSSVHTSRLAVEERDRLKKLEDTYDVAARSQLKTEIERIQEDRQKIEAKILKASEDERKRAFVGYDVETQTVPKSDFGEEDSASLLSHQFYIAHNGNRVGFIILTDRRFTEKAFTKLIAEVVPKSVKKAYVVAHYSLVEGGWMIEDRISKSEFSLLFEAAYYPRMQAAIDAEIDIATKIVHAVWDEAKKKDSETDDVEDRENNPIRLDMLQLSQPAKDTILSFRRRRDSVKAVLSGYARYSIGEDKYGKEQQVPAILLSEHTRNQLRRKGYESVVIQKRGRTWQGTVQQMPKSKREGLLKLAKKQKDEWITQVSEEEMVGFHNTVLMSVMERNSISNLRDETAGNQLWFKAAGLERDTGKRPKVKGGDKEELYEKYRPLLMEFCDTMHFSTDEGKSLKAFGNMIDIPKLDLADGRIEDMAKFLEDDTETFYRYGIRDSVITAEALAFYGRLFLLELDTPLSTRITGYSRKVFRKVLIGDDEFKRGVYEEKINEATEKRKQLQAEAKRLGTGEKIYKLPEENLKHYLGFQRTKKKDNSNYWWPGFDAQSFVSFYGGGWNDSRVVGSWGPCIYYDLKSAYISAVLMKFSYDYDMSRSVEYVGIDAHRKALEMLKEKNPFQIAGVEIAFEFKDEVEPIFPVRFDPRRLPNLSMFEFSEQLIYTKVGTTCVGWPEFAVAMEHGLLKDDYKILRLVTYPKIGEGSIFADEIEYLLRMRGEPGKKMLYKEICNFLYGQTAMGVSRAITIDERGLSESKTAPGGLTCIPIAAYCTSFCRACMGELLALGNPAYAITTDGFISPVPLEKLRKEGIILSATNDRLRSLTSVSTGKPLGYEFIEADFIAEQSLFLKTRGYILIGNKSNGEPGVKMAKMGVQTKAGASDINDLYDPQVLEFLSHLKAGEYPKKCWQGFKLLKKNNQNKLPIPVIRKSTLSHTYDFKRMPAREISEESFSYGGIELSHPKFSTQPLTCENEFKRLRTESARLGMKNATVEDYKKLLTLVKK